MRGRGSPDGCRVSVWGDGKGLGTAVMVAQHCECDECHWIIHSEKVEMAALMSYVFYCSEKELNAQPAQEKGNTV